MLVGWNLIGFVHTERLHWIDWFTHAYVYVGQREEFTLVYSQVCLCRAARGVYTGLLTRLSMSGSARSLSKSSDALMASPRMR